MSRVERIDGPRDNTPHDEANCPSCQEDIAAMTQPAPAPDVPEPVHRWRYHAQAGQLEGACFLSASEDFVRATDHDSALAAKDAVIAELERKLKVQTAVADLAYIPHRHLVERNEALQARLAALEVSASPTADQRERT